MSVNIWSLSNTLLNGIVKFFNACYIVLFHKFGIGKYSFTMLSLGGSVLVVLLGLMLIKKIL